MDRYFKSRIISKEIGHIQTDTTYSHQIKLIISNEGTFPQILLIVSVPCHAPQVHTPAVNKYVGVLLPRTRQGPYCTGIGQMDRGPTLCQTNIFTLWPQSFNDKLIISFPALSGSNWVSVSTRDGTVSTLEGFPEHILGCFGTSGRHGIRSGRHGLRSGRHECPFQTKTHDCSVAIHFHLL
ncbi:hypothetical protein Taro_032134, partial [Colocasia esculenta]|nr:hypothetical protein [Colocasia esculenta]